MTDERIDEAEVGLEAPARGSADELLDAGAHSELDAMRHSTAHVMAEAVLDLFPGTRLGIGPAIDDGFYYDFELPRPLTPDDLAAIEARMAAEHRRRPPVRAPRAAAGRGSCLLRRARAAVQGGDPRRPRVPVEARRDTDAADLGLRTRALRRPVQGAARRLAPGRSGRSSCSPSRAPTGEATRSARCSSASTARSGRTRRTSIATCGDARRRRSATIAASASSSICSASTTSARARPSGTLRAGRCTGRSRAPCASCRTAAATRRSTRRRSSISASGNSRVTGTSTASTCSCSSPKGRPTASSR